MTESGTWQSTVRPKLAPYGDLERVENRVGLGTPDVNYCLIGVEGWFEMKQADHWPTRETTKFLLPHFTREQLLWQERRSKANGRCCLLAHVGNDYFILPPWRLREIFDGATRETYATLATVFGSGAFPTKDILLWLTKAPKGVNSP